MYGRQKKVLELAGRVGNVALSVRNRSRADGKSRGRSIYQPILYSNRSIRHRYCDTPQGPCLFRLSLGRSVTNALHSKRGIFVPSYIRARFPNICRSVRILPNYRAIVMAAVLAPSSAHSSSHFVPHRDTFGAFQQHRSLSASYRNPFDAFSAHHHSSAKSRSAAASWRYSGPQTVAPAPARVDTPSPKFRRTGPSHRRTPSTSSEASSTGWRSDIRSAPVTRVDVTEEARSVHHSYFVLDDTE